MSRPFDLQGHRGARGLKPENSLPSFEVALDHGVSSIETDLHLSRDGEPILNHDATLSEHLCRLVPGSLSPDPRQHPLVSSLTLAQLRDYRVDGNPHPDRFPVQESRVTPLARRFAERYKLDPYVLPRLAELFSFVASYGDRLGAEVGKTDAQRARACAVTFDLELKRLPFHPEVIGDAFDGSGPGLLEQRVVETVRRAGVVERTVVRSFDHRSVRAVRQLLPEVRTAVLVACTAPVAPAHLAKDVDATTYCPDFTFLDEIQVWQLHEAGIRVVPWTVNEPADLARLLEWGVDGVTTDYPDRMAEMLRLRGITF
jgi:glycerophosphoryl diester phosphodiesterase